MFKGYVPDDPWFYKDLYALSHPEPGEPPKLPRTFVFEPWQREVRKGQ
jgi:hypothetical protein